MMPLGGMMVGRNDLPHVFKMTQSAKSALHVGRMVARHARDRLRHSRGTRLVNGNALVAKLAVNAFARGIPLWLSSPVVELLTENGRVSGAVVERDGQRLSVHARRGVVLACGGFPANQDLKRASTAISPPARTTSCCRPRAIPATGCGLRKLWAAASMTRCTSRQPGRRYRWCRRRDGSTVPFPHFFDRGKPGYISVDRRGRRFVNEAKSYHVFVPAMIEACRRRCRGRGLGRLRSQGHPPVRPRRAGAGADAHQALPRLRLYQARGERGGPCGGLRHRSRKVWSGPLPPSTGRPVVARIPSCSAGRMPISASTGRRATRPIRPSRRSIRRRSMPCASCRANSAPSPASPPMPAPG